MSLPAPVLSYVGSVDTTSLSAGVNMFKMLFDSSITGVLMFEYKIVSDVGSAFPAPDDVTTGFINPDSAQSQGISNQWLVPVPSTGTGYNPHTNVRIRVYPANGLNVTPWSNALSFYNPPTKPHINSAKFDADSSGSYLGDDDLWVLLDHVEGNDNTELQYLLAYYYVDDSGTTVWQVSDLLTPVNYNGSDQWVLHVALNNDVSMVQRIIYVAAHTVYPFAGNEFYTVSEISNTFVATPAANTPPVLDPLVYDYTAQPNQLINLTWQPPTSAFIGAYSLQNYFIWLNGVNIATVDALATTYQYVNLNLTCGTQLSFSVQAISATGYDPLMSNSESVYVFTTASAPATLSYNWALYTDQYLHDEVAVSFNFTNPADIGCGSEPIVNWYISPDAGATQTVSGTVPYFSGNAPYSVTTSFPYIDTNIYRIYAYVSTLNSNDTTQRIDGAIQQSSSIDPADVPLIYNVDTIVSGLQTSGVNFNVASAIEVAPVCTFTYWDSSNNTMDIRPWLMTEQDEPVYDEVNNVYIYTVTLMWANFVPTITPYPPRFIISVANASGIGTRAHGAIQPIV